MEEIETLRWIQLSPLPLGLALLALAFVIGKLVDRSHFRSLARREQRSRNFPALTLRDAPADWRVSEADLVTGSVVISLDHWKRLAATFRGLIGGRVRSYETLLVRARREALLRLKERAFERGFRAVINVRFETARLASSRRDGEGTVGVEILAFGTALKLAK